MELRDIVLRQLATRSFAVLSTTSPAGRPHAAGVLYAAVGTTLWVSTLRGSRKARNVAANGHVAVCVPVRRSPVGPPSTIQFQARAEVVAVDDPRVRPAELGAITSHGELDLPDGCLLRIEPAGRVHTFGLGMSLLRLARDPLHAAGSVDLTGAAEPAGPR
jgi:pyridoxine/pyridoxamine 5'-phosphate oxidase